MVILGIPTLNRYDLLAKCIESAEQGSVTPDKYYIIDNGGKLNRALLPDLGERLEIYYPGYNLGVAASWNVLCRKFLPDNKLIISNDDLEFFPDTLEKLCADSTPSIRYPAGISGANAFTCFLIHAEVFESVGEFDEKISPGYAYFEDNDYFIRSLKKGYFVVGVLNCNILHQGSSTLEKYSQKERQEHHRKFKLARDNYIKKWGGLPGKETLTVPKEL